jgi:hypothetical protein
LISKTALLISTIRIVDIKNTVADGDTQLFADLVNGSLQQVSNDLSPLPPKCSIEINDAANEYVIEPFEVFNILSRINIHKSPGPDGIPNWFLRDFAFATEPVCHICNASISKGVIPNLWKKASVVPIPKYHPLKSI